MTINYFDEDELCNIDLLSDAYVALEEILKEENIDVDVELSLSLVGEEEIKELNRDYRNIDKSTDVLSFPSIDFNTPSDMELIKSLPEAYYNMDKDELILGDVIICYDIALLQAKNYGHSLRRELVFLFTHSVYHLLGYDHIEDDDRRIMEGKQRDLLNNLQIGRDE